jgi:hemolysin activation/secretion protein
VAASVSSGKPRWPAPALIALALGLTPPASPAQTGPDAGALQQQLQREIERARPTAPAQPSLRKPTAPTEMPTGAETIEVRAFRVTGNTVVSDAEIQVVLAPFAGRALTISQIREAAAAVTRLYQDHGRVAQAVIPPQNVVDGVIEIRVIEGRVGEIRVRPADGGASLRLSPERARAMVEARNRPGELLRLDNLERGLAIINELPGVQAIGELEPGKTEGGTDIRVDVRNTDLVAGRIDLSNYGAANTGAAQAIGNLSINDPAGLGDAFTLDVIGSSGSTYGQLRYMLPAGDDGWRVGLGGATLSYQSLASWSPTMTQGHANTAGLYASYPLLRTSARNQTFTAQIENRDYANLTAGTEISNYTIQALSAGINASEQTEHDFTTWGLTATVGRMAIHNDLQSVQDRGSAQTAGGYARLAANAARTSPLPWRRTHLQLSVYGQIASRNLNSSEQLYLGGPYAVRAYPVAQGGASNGLIASAEMVRTLENQMQYGTFADIGLVQQYVRTWDDWQLRTHAGNTYPVSGVGLLGRYAVSRVQLSGTLAWRIGSNPLWNSLGEQLNADNRYRTVQAWVKATAFF